MATKLKKAARLSTKKKKWFQILAPKFLGDKVIGESYLSEPTEAIKRTVKINLMQITGDIKTQNIGVKFEITDFKDNKLHTSIIDYEYLPASVKRLIRRNMTRVDDSILAVTKDGHKVRLKPLLITKDKVSKAVEKKLRAELRAELLKLIGNSTYEGLYSEIIQNRIQNELRKKFNTIYPVRGVLIRIIKKEVGETKRNIIKNEAAIKPKQELKTEPKAEVKEETKEEIKEEKPKKKESVKKPVKKTVKPAKDSQKKE